MLRAYNEYSPLQARSVCAWMSNGLRPVLVLVLVLALCTVTAEPAQAKKKHSTSVVSHHATATHHSTHHSSHLKQTASGRAARSQSANISSRSRNHSIIVTTHHHGRAEHHVVHVVHHSAPVSYPEPHAENVQNSNSLASVYHLYDRGVNERLDGRYEQATKTLLEANNSYASSQKGLTLEAMINYELGQAAEASNNYSLAADAYGRTLRLKPNMIDASVRLASLLMKAGHPDLALSRAREAVAMYPNDPRAHQILALVLDKTGANADAKVERDSAKNLINSGSSVNTETTDVSGDSGSQPSPASNPSRQVDLDLQPKKEPLTTEPPKPPGEPVDNDVMP